MENLLNIFIIGLLILLGGLPTLYLTFSVPIVIVYKFYRKFHYGISLMK